MEYTQLYTKEPNKSQLGRKQYKSGDTVAQTQALGICT